MKPRKQNKLKMSRELQGLRKACKEYIRYTKAQKWRQFKVCIEGIYYVDGKWVTYFRNSDVVMSI